MLQLDNTGMEFEDFVTVACQKDCGAFMNISRGAYTSWVMQGEWTSLCIICPECVRKMAVQPYLN